MASKRQLITIVLVVLMAISAGCAGWGQDGPTDQGQDGNDTNDTNDTAVPNESNASNDTGANTTNSADGRDDSDGSGDGASSGTNSGGDGTADTSGDDGDGDTSTESQSQSQSAEGQSASDSDSDSGSDTSTSDSSSDTDSSSSDSSSSSGSDTNADSDDSSDASSDSDSSSSDSDSDSDQDSDSDSDTDTDTIDGGDSDGQDSSSEEPAAPEEPEEPNESNEPDEPNETTQYASPSDLELDEINHMGGEAGPDRDEATFRNTNQEHPLPVGGWTVETNNEHWNGQVVIPEGTVLGPGETVTVQFPTGEKALHESGGILYVSDGGGALVGEYSHVGTPSAPSIPPEEEVTSVSVSVEDSSDESVDGVHGASVTLAGDEEYTGTTDEGGTAAFSEVRYGEYELTVEREDYETHTETVTVDNPDGLVVMVALDRTPQEPEPEPTANETNESVAA